MIEMLEQAYGRRSCFRLDETSRPGLTGALAGLESFYAAFNNRHLDQLTDVWSADPLVQLNNPLGGMVRGIVGIRSLYDRVFSSNGRAWVEFGDIVAHDLGEAVVFAGRECGEFATEDDVVPLSIRTSRIFAFEPRRGWRQVHHHGSIDDPSALNNYQQAVQRATGRR